MSVYKELFWTAEQVEKRSKRIYPDACDYGVPISSNNDELIMMVKQCVDMYDGKVTTDTYGTGSTQTIVIRGFNEGTGEKVVFHFEYVYISRNSRGQNKDMIGYLWLVSRSDREVNVNG